MTQINKKKENTQQLHSIDLMHTEMLNKFHKIETETIPNLEENRKKLKEQEQNKVKNQV